MHLLERFILWQVSSSLQSDLQGRFIKVRRSRLFERKHVQLMLTTDGGKKADNANYLPRPVYPFQAQWELYTSISPTSTANNSVFFPQSVFFSNSQNRDYFPKQHNQFIFVMKIRLVFLR
jgi:hypothetical protein